MGQSDWSQVRWLVKCVEAEDDVDEDDLEAFGPVAGEISEYGFIYKHTDDAEGKKSLAQLVYKLKGFCLDVLNIEADDDATLKELMAETKSCQFLAMATHRIREDTGEAQIQLKGASAAD